MRFDELTAPQEQSWQSLKEEAAAIGRTILEHDWRAGSLIVERGVPSDESGTRSTNESRSRALAAVERASKEQGVPDHASERVTHALEHTADPQSRLAHYIVEASDANYLSAFRSWLGDPAHGHREWNTAEVDAYRRVKGLARAMSLGTTTAGGFLLPYALDPQILVNNTGSVDPMRQVSSVRLTALNEQRFVTSAGVTASWDPEAQEVSDDSPTLAQPAITAFKGQAFVPVSLELFEDSDLSSQIGGLFADAKTQLESAAFTLGSGSAEPKGVITAVAAVAGSVVTSAGSALAIADVVANQNALPPRWRSNARFQANLSMINAARQIPMYANGPSIVNDSTTPPRCFGWELAENSRIDGTIAAGSTHDYVWLSGDFRQYQITDRVGTMLEVIQTLFGSNGRPTGQRGFHMHWRTGGDVLIPDAFRLTDYSS